MDFDSFVVAGNEQLVATLVTAGTAPQRHQQVYLWGESGSGKTHLLSACCHRAAGEGLRVAYLPAEILLEVSSVAGLGDYDLVCVDDLQRLPGRADSEEALFALINAARVGSAALLFAATQKPDMLSLGLEDLRTRLAWSVVYRLHALDDAGLRAAVSAKARYRGMVLSDDVLEYILRHYPRDMHSLTQLIRELDVFCLQHQRKPSIPALRALGASQTS